MSAKKSKKKLNKDQLHKISGGANMGALLGGGSGGGGVITKGNIRYNTKTGEFFLVVGQNKYFIDGGDGMISVSASKSLLNQYDAANIDKDMSNMTTIANKYNVFIAG